MSGKRIDGMGGRLDRSRKIAFRFNGRSFSGFEGEKLSNIGLQTTKESLLRLSKVMDYLKPKNQR